MCRPRVEAACAKSSMKSRSEVASRLLAVGAVKSEGCAGDGSGAEGAEVHARAGVGEARIVALEHGDVSEQPVRDEDGFGALEVGVAGHDGGAGFFSEGDE